MTGVTLHLELIIELMELIQLTVIGRLNSPVASISFLTLDFVTSIDKKN